VLRIFRCSDFSWSPGCGVAKASFPNMQVSKPGYLCITVIREGSHRQSSGGSMVNIDSPSPMILTAAIRLVQGQSCTLGVSFGRPHVYSLNRMRRCPSIPRLASSATRHVDGPGAAVEFVTAFRKDLSNDIVHSSLRPSIL
jgi:hypothetical protein